MYIYLLSFMLLTFSTNSYASNCKIDYLLLEIKYSALLEEYNGYRNQAIKFVPNIERFPRCFPSYDPAERKKDNEITEFDCAKLRHSISMLEDTMFAAAYKAYDACMYKNRDDVAECRKCDTLVKREKNHTGLNLKLMDNLFDGKYASRICGRTVTGIRQKDVYFC